MDTRKPLTGALLLIGVGAALGIGYNLVQPRPLPWKGEKMKAVQLSDAETASPTQTTPMETQDETPTDPQTATEAGGGMEQEASPTPAAETQTPEAQAAETQETQAPETRAPATQAAAAGTPTEAATQDPSPRGQKQFKPTDPSMGREDVYKDIPESEYPIEIHLDKAKEFYDRGGLLVLDARDLSEYEDGHIKGAESAPTDQMIADLDWMNATAKDPRPIMVYCSGGDCELSMTLGFEISHTGHRRVLVFEDGYPAWQEAGYPVSTGDKP